MKLPLGIALWSSAVLCSKLLILHDGDEVVKSHLLQGYTTESKTLKEFSGTIVDYDGDGNLYDKLVFVSSKMPRGFQQDELVEFVKRGSDVLWVLPSSEHLVMSRDAIETAAQFGFTVDQEPALLADLFDNGPLKTNSSLRDLSHISEAKLPAMKRSVAFSIDRSNPLAFAILSASPRAAAICPAGRAATRCSSWYGTDAVVAGALQARNGARVLLVASDSLLQNSPFATDLVAWALRDKSILRLDSFRVLPVHKADPSTSTWQVRDKVEIKACLSEDGRQSKGRTVQPLDVQVELVLMDPWMRLNLSPSADGCLSSGPFSLPDRFGIFSVRLRYQRHGWTHLIEELPLSVHPLRNDQQTRFLFAAMPFYLSWLGLLASSCLLVVPLLLGELATKA